MPGRAVRLADKTASAPFFAEAALFHRIDRFHSVDFIDIVAVTRGTGVETHYPRGADPIRRPLKPGRMVLYRPGDDVMIAASSSEGVVVRYVSFPVGEWMSFAAIVGVDGSWATSALPPGIDFDIDDSSVLRPFDAAIERFSSDPTPLDLARFWVDVIPTMFPSGHSRFPGVGAPRWLRDAVEEMRREENLRVGVSRLRGLAYVSASHLSATTRRYYGKSPSELVLEMRLRHAALLLSSTTESVGSISERCGFASFPHFSAVFRRSYQLTPRDYRSQAATRFGATRR
jgi:AraC-like DNA-binding protein